MKTEHAFLAGLKWVAIGRFSAQLISWVGTIYVMRTLAPQDFGLAAICSTLVAIITMGAEFGIGAGIIQAQSLDKTQVRSVFGAALLFGLAGALLMLAAAPAMTWYFRAPEALLLIQVSALHLLLAPLATIPDAFLRRAMQFRGASLVEFGSALAATLGTVSLAWAGKGVWALVLGPLGGAAARVLLLHALAPQRLSPSLDLRPARGLIGFGLKVAVSRVGSYVFGQSDVLVAGRSLSKTALGEYSVAMHLAMLPVSKVMNIVNTVAYPTIAQMNREGESVRPALLTGLRLFAYLLVPVLWGLATVAPWLIELLLGAPWAGAVLPLQIVCAVLPLRLVSVLLSSVLQGLGHAGLELRNTLTGVLLLLPCFVLGAQFGAVGLAGGWVLGLPLMVALNLRRAHGVLQIGILDALRAVGRPMLCSGLMCAGVAAAGLALGRQGSTVLGVTSMVLTGMLAYALALWLLDRASATRLLGLARGVAH
ncbi:MAG TPA: lipopolysaccharide biosynthesis protein [Roseateles sp.]|nr:lipopolysaccharide biosynthesis protein [Roseateles sp.]